MTDQTQLTWQGVAALVVLALFVLGVLALVLALT